MTPRRCLFLLAWLPFLIPAPGAGQGVPPGGGEAPVSDARVMGFPLASPASVGLSEEGLARATEVLRRHVDAGDVAGVVAAVLRDGRLVYHEAVGLRSLEEGDPISLDALFRVYSMTRNVTSVGVLLLHQEGALHLDDPVTRYLPEFQPQEVWLNPSDPGEGTRPRQGEVTLAHLLTHTSGLGSRSSAPYRAADVHGWDRSLDEVVRRVAALPLFEDPGTRYRYGLHAEVLGRVIEVVSEMPVERFLRERLFEPLGMRDAVFFVDPERTPRLAPVYRRGAEGGLALHEMETIPVTEARALTSAGVGLVASTEDFLRFSQFLLDEGVTLDGVRLLDPETARLARENAVPEGLLPLGGSGYWAGSGWSLGGFAVALDPGAYPHPVTPGTFWWDGSAGTRFWIDPVEGMVVIVQAQVSPASGGGFREGFMTRVQEAVIERRGGVPGG